MNKKILVVAAHPDDEVLGVGGTIAMHAQDGDIVHIMIMAEGITSRDDTRNASAHSSELDELHANCKSVADLLGAEKLILCKFPDNRMDSVDLLDVVKEIEKEIEDFKPEIVYTHHAGDVNIDHTVTHNAVITACRSFPGQSVKSILFFETLSSTEWQMATCDKVFQPTWFVPLSRDSFKKKEAALKLYESEMRPYPYPRSYKTVEHLARYRGSIVGEEFAEAFSLGRCIVKIDGGGYKYKVVFSPFPLRKLSCPSLLGGAA